MQFKDRFKGRTTIVSKEGVINTLAAPSNNPVNKSQSNAQFIPTSNPKTQVPYPQSDNPSYNSTFQRQPVDRSLENRPVVPNYNPQHSQLKTPVGHSQNIQSYQQQQQRIPSGNPNQSPGKNPYLVNNPFPVMEQIERPYASYDDSAQQQYGRSELPTSNRQPIPQNPPINQVNQFNPNSFYNQHSQFKSNLIDLTPRKDSPVEKQKQANYGGFNPQQIAKKKFENLSQQNKQMRMAEEAVRGFESPNFSQQRPPVNNRYGEFNQPPNMFYNGDYPYRPPQMGQQYMQQNQQMQMQMPNPMPFNGYREIHSNPAPHQHLENNAFGGYYGGGNNMPNNMMPNNNMGNMSQQQYERRPVNEGSPSKQPPSSSPHGSKSENQSATNFKPYNLKDYKDIKKGPAKLGGLGANTNTDEWYKEKDKRDRMTEFSQNVKLFNMQRLPITETGFKPRKEKEKEKERSRREIALDFAKNIPKPKQRRNSPIEEEPMEDLYTKKSESDMIINYGGSDDLDVFEKRHNFYAAQLQRLKNN